MNEIGNWPWRLSDRSLSVLALYCASEGSMGAVDVGRLYGGRALVVDIGVPGLGFVRLMKLT